MKRIFAVAVLLFILFLFFAPLLIGPLVISGYGGMSSSVESIEAPEYDNLAFTRKEIALDGTSASIYPPAQWVAGFWIGDTGLRIEVGQPEFVMKTAEWDEREVLIIDTDGDGVDDMNKTKTWKTSIAEFDLSATARTDGDAVSPIRDVTFWIRIEENQYNVFDAPDDVRAYVLEVVTREEAELSNEVLIDVDPAASGYTIPMNPLKRDSPPQWILDSGYQGSLSYLESVAIPLKVLNAAPFVFGLSRSEIQATWRLKVRVLVFGFWERVSPYDEWIPPSVPPGWLDWLWDLLRTIGLTFWLLIAGGLSILAVWKGGKYGPVYFVVVWALFIGLAYLTGLLVW